MFVTESAVADPTVGAAVELVATAGAYPKAPNPIEFTPPTRV